MVDRDIARGLADLENELAELLEERRREMARPMRGTERNQIRAKFQRAEERLRSRMAELAGEGGPSIDVGKEDKS